MTTTEHDAAPHTGAGAEPLPVLPYQIMPEMSEEEYRQLKEDIRHKGVLEPIVFDQDGMIIDGHHRFRAFSELVDEGADLPMFEKIVRRFTSDEERIDYVISYNVKRRHLTPEQRQQLVLVLRKRGYTLAKISTLLHVSVITISRDIKDLPAEERAELEKIPVVSSDGRVFTGSYTPSWIFVEGEKQLRRLQAQAKGDVAEAKTQELDELAKKWNVSAGDLWLVPSKNRPGSYHRVMCGNTLNAHDLMRVCGSAAPRLVVTSPPYNQNLHAFKPSGMQLESPSYVQRLSLAYKDGLPEEEYQQQQLTMMSLVHAVTTPDASFFYNHKLRYRDVRVLPPTRWIDHTENPWVWRSEIIWDRYSGTAVNARMFTLSDERIYWLYKGEEFYFSDTPETKAWTTVWRIAPHNELDVSAPFANEIPRRCIIACSEIGDAVLDPYAGSGTTLAESERLSRIGYALEIDPRYVAVILQRMVDMGLEPFRAGDHIVAG